MSEVVAGNEGFGNLEPLYGVSAARVVMRAEGLTKSYPRVGAKGTGHGDIVLFRDLELEIRAGEMVAIVGESGTGKSTLLHLLAALDRPTDGEVWCGDRRVSRFSAAEAAKFRNHDVGYVWQFHYLLPEFSALENVAMPLLARGDGSRRGDGTGKDVAW